MSRNRQNVFTRPTIISNFKSPKSLKERDVHHRSLDCASSLDFYSDSTRCFLVMTEENGNRSSLEDFRPISKISHQICVTYFLIRTWSLHWLCNLSNKILKCNTIMSQNYYRQSNEQTYLRRSTRCIKFHWHVGQLKIRRNGIFYWD